MTKYNRKKSNKTIFFKDYIKQNNLFDTIIAYCNYCQEFKCKINLKNSEIK